MDFSHEHIATLMRHVVAGIVNIYELHDGQGNRRYIDPKEYPSVPVYNLYMQAVKDIQPVHGSYMRIDRWFNAYWQIFPFGHLWEELAPRERTLVEHTHKLCQQLFIVRG